MYGLLLKAPQFKWVPENKGLPYPYICGSNCVVGYIWQRETKKCVKIVRNVNAKSTYSKAAVGCANDNARLLSIDRCEQFKGLQNDLWTKYPGTNEKYWIGYYAEGFAHYTDQKRVSTDLKKMIAANGLKGVLPNGVVNNCAGKEFNVPMIDSSGNSVSNISPSSDGFFSQFVFTGTQQAKMMLHSFNKANSPTSIENYLCEKENNWVCPEGYIMFQEVCYKMFEELSTLAGADKICKTDGGKVLEIQTRMHQNFINGWMDSENFNTNQTWLGYKRKTISLVEAAYKPLDSNANTPGFDFETVIDFTEANHAAPGNDDDCVVMERTSSSGFVNGWKKVSCFEQAAVICQRSQVVHSKVLNTLPIPEIMMPLDKSIGFGDYNKRLRGNVDNLVAITNEGNRKSNLIGSAHFIGKPSSYIDIPADGNDEIFVNFGISVLMWIKIDRINKGERQFLLDGSGICEAGTETDHSFLLFLEKGTPAASGDIDVFDLSTPCGDLLGQSGAGTTTTTATNTTTASGGSGSSIVNPIQLIPLQINFQL